MNKIFILTLIVVIFFLIDWYSYSAVKVSFQGIDLKGQKWIGVSYWTISIICYLLILSFVFYNPENIDSIVRNFLITFVFTNLLSKLFIPIFLLLEDLYRLVVWLFTKISFWNPAVEQPIDIERAEFISTASLAVAVVPSIAVGYGILSGAHDYRVKQVNLVIPQLPRTFEGLKIVQISDIHSGSFFNKRAVQGGVETIMNQKADMVFFTGDLVNNEAKEMKEWVSVFDKIKAPLGVYSTLGNHDYGDYKAWKSVEEKKNNLADLKRIHRNMGWQLLMNEHKKIVMGGDEIAVLGIENWGKGDRWPKYGKMELAYRNTQDSSVKLLLSHDPSHWDAQVRTMYPDIDVSFAGHTHGFQFGVGVGENRWSPVQYVYKQWSGLYKEGNQQLYVNQGFGYIGFPGRVGMPPEITVFKLTSTNES